MPQIWGLKLQGLEFTSDVQGQKALNKLTKETVHKMSLFDYGWCGFGLKCSWMIALRLSGDSIQFDFTPCLGIKPN